MTATEFTIVAAASVVTALTVVTAPLPIVIVILVAGVLLIALYTSLPIWETLLIAAFLAEQYLVDIDIGPASARVYFILAALAGVCARTLVSRRALFPHADARRFALTYGVLIAWMLVCQWVDGRSPNSILENLLSGPVMSLAVFVAAQSLLDSAPSQQRVALLFGAVAVVSSIAAILQWLGVQAAWDLATMIRPNERSRAVMFGLVGGRGELAETDAFAWAPGLTLFAVTLNIQLLSFGFIVLFWGTARARAWTGWALGIACALLALAGIFVSQQRSGILIAPVLLAVIAFGSQSSTRRLRAATATILLASVAVAMGLMAGELWSTTGAYSLDRLRYLDPSLRADVIGVAWQTGSQNWAFGSATAYSDVAVRELNFHSSPHNYFATAFALYGIGGFALVCVMAVLIVRIVRQLLACHQSVPWSHGPGASGWLRVAVAFGVIAYLCNAQFHSADFLTGDPTPSWLLGVASATMGSNKSA